MPTTNENRLARSSLTNREIQVLRLVAQGHPNKWIARNLEIAEATVETHLCNIYRKLDVQSRIQAMLCATRAGLIN
jgi:DNA-binding NarL/FixJ family response regulator